MTTLTAITAARIFDGFEWHENCALLVEGENVVGIVPSQATPTDAVRVDYDGQQVVPGFIDLQVNGGGGLRFGVNASLDEIAEMARAHARFGTTKLLPTLITDTAEVTARALQAGRDAHAARVPGFLGLHLEGPHLSLARKGAHNPSFIRPMTTDDLEAIVDYRRQAGFILTTVAPENVSAEQVKKLVEAGVVVSIGHSDVTLETARAYFDAGASMVTHLFNAMSQLTNREPGIVGAALEDGRIFAGLIADGIHVDPVTMRIALRAKSGPGDIFLVTDAMQTIGTSLPGFTLNGREIIRSKGSLRLADGTLAGADIDMLASVKLVHSILGLPIERAFAMSSRIPAEAVGLGHRYGLLRQGYVADFVVLSDVLDHVDTWVDGRRVRFS